MSLRAVAVSSKIAPNAIYRYFNDHAHLEAAVGAEVCRRLHEVLRKAVRGREPEAAVSLWAFIHGMAALQSAQLLGAEKPITRFDFGLKVWLAAGRESRPPQG